MGRVFHIIASILRDPSARWGCKRYVSGKARGKQLGGFPFGLFHSSRSLLFLSAGSYNVYDIDLPCRSRAVPQLAVCCIYFPAIQASSRLSYGARYCIDRRNAVDFTTRGIIRATLSRWIENIDYASFFSERSTPISSIIGLCISVAIVTPQVLLYTYTLCFISELRGIR